MKVLNYRVILKKEKDTGYTAIVPSLPGCITYVETLEKAKTLIKEAIELYIESLKAHNESIPNDKNTLEYVVSFQLLRRIK
jgi:predicted RNase H-like HicB family nuclease